MQSHKQTVSEDRSVVPAYRLLFAGDTALVVEFGNRIDRRLSAQVLTLADRLNELRLDGVIDIVPRSLTIHYDPLVLSGAVLCTRISALTGGLKAAETRGRRWRLPVCYDARMAPDLKEVAARTGLSPDEIIERHFGVTFHVYMLGFLPGQPYLGDLPPELALPRRRTPRLKIPAGSVAIANTLTSIFPRESPCGWYLIGRSPVPFFHLDPIAAALVLPGDAVAFSPVSFREFEDISARIAAGDFAIHPSEDVTEAAA